MNDPLLNSLNSQQQAAVLHDLGPLVVFAGAGSGKTRVITTRIARLINAGVPPWSILAVTFTNKAAGEMRERLLQQVSNSESCTIATFHAAAAKWLREFAPHLGFSSHFTIYDDSDVNAALKAVLKKLSPEGDALKLLPEIKSFLHTVKTLGLFPSDIESMQGQMAIEVPTGGIAVYKAYQEFLNKCNAMDFNDLLLNMLLLVRRNKVVKEILQKRYQYVLVDEYQDTNPVQFELIGNIVEKSRNLFVVGDDDQSIYSWRGATPANIIDFERHYPDAQRIVLEQNYRSSSTIVDAANAMIAKNINRAAKKTFTENDSGQKIDLHVDSDGEMEVWWVVDSIEREKSTFSYEQVAIFYRTNSMSRSVEDALRRQNIPYKIYGAVKFYDRVEIKDVMAYLRLAVNQADDVSLRRVVNVPARGIGQKALATIDERASSLGTSMMQAARVMSAEKSRLSSKLGEFVRVIDQLVELTTNGDLGGLVQRILHLTSYAEHLKKKHPEQYLDKIENVHELASALTEFEQQTEGATLEGWLESVTLVRDDGQDINSGVSLMTLHMAKGLEYDRVFIVGAEDGILPHYNSVDDPGSIEEERRLMYVGMTRAKQKLSISCAQRRRVYNQVQTNPPSRFLEDIPEKYLELTPGGQAAFFHADTPSYEGDTELSYESDAGSDFAPISIEPGEAVYHDAYGKGTIKTVHPVMGDIKVIVEFWEFGERKVSARYLQQG